ncbi:MAG: HlyD family efflux transporter periplasmic adaptor subunit [Gammaproteobacteria bacterium]|nr:HlyD family efflux transporter periplasmic adaptor subunit [Gammaproteobacteria bacterium]
MFQQPVPTVRQDLNLLPAQTDENGHPAWLLHDPLSGRYFRLGRVEVELLTHLGAGDSAAVASSASASLGEAVLPERVDNLLLFLRGNNLVDGDDLQQRSFLRQRNSRDSWVTHLAKSYLFIRIPLFNPDRFLETTLPWVKWILHPVMRTVLLLLLITGFWLTLRQSEQFYATFIHFFTPEGMVLFAIAVIMVKVLHELGHAYVAKAYGCKVPVIGVAFLVLWPVLYTDTTDSWRLTDRRARLRIGSAGMAVEIVIAIISLFLWNLADEGGVKSTLFLLATSTWVMSLLVNLNPLMRFDGYYLFSDWISIPNLEHRAHAMARYWMRERLFALQQPPPEPLDLRLVLFAFAVWTYRFILFIGIALLVYYLFFKLLGILLFMLEIGYFILAPIGREVVRLYKVRHLFHMNITSLRTVAVFGLVVGLVLIPWQGTVELAAVYGHRYQPIYAPHSGALSGLSVNNGDFVMKAQPLFAITSPELDFDLQQRQRRLFELQQQRIASGFSALDSDRTLVIASDIAGQLQTIRTLQRRHERLQVSASVAGEVVNMNPGLRKGDWLTEGEYILTIRDPERVEITAYLPESDITRLRLQQKGLFYPDGGGFEPFEVEVTEIEDLGLDEILQPMVASLFGGRVAVRENSSGEMIPVTATYRVQLQPSAQRSEPLRQLRGTVVVNGVTESFFSRSYRKVVAILVRESGF